LTDTFPDRVTALMGNHELELLKDREKENEFKYLNLAYSAVHPQGKIDSDDSSLYDSIVHRIVIVLPN
jgi:hypothetical protein